jgi:hypothetical protein
LEKRQKARLRFKQYDDEADYQRQERKNTWSLLNMFAGLPVHDYLKGSKIDSLENLLILQKEHHYFFGALNLRFMETPVLYPLPMCADASLAGRNIHYSHLSQSLWGPAKAPYYRQRKEGWPDRQSEQSLPTSLPSFSGLTQGACLFMPIVACFWSW